MTLASAGQQFICLVATDQLFLNLCSQNQNIKHFPTLGSLLHLFSIILITLMNQTEELKPNLHCKTESMGGGTAVFPHGT